MAQDETSKTAKEEGNIDVGRLYHILRRIVSCVARNAVGLG